MKLVCRKVMGVKTCHSPTTFTGYGTTFTFFSPSRVVRQSGWMDYGFASTADRGANARLCRSWKCACRGNGSNWPLHWHSVKYNYIVLYFLLHSDSDKSSDTSNNNDIDSGTTNEQRGYTIRLEWSRPVAACASRGHRIVTSEVRSAHVSDYFVHISFWAKKIFRFSCWHIVLRRCHSSCTNYAP